MGKNYSKRRRIVWLALDSLPRDGQAYRVALLLMHDYCIIEIAQELNISTRQVKMAKTEIREALIAAGILPEMFEALAEAVEKYGKSGGPWNVPSEPGSWIAKAKEALKKARGK